MTPLITAIIVVALILLTIIMRSASRHTKVIQAIATIVDIETQYGWKEGERWERSAWGGDLQKERTWQMYYVITAKGALPETQHLRTFHTTAWADELDSTPAKGNQVQVQVDARHPEQYSIDLQPFSITADTLKSANA
jgi:hypothetical protein